MTSSFGETIHGGDMVDVGLVTLSRVVLMLPQIDAAPNGGLLAVPESNEAHTTSPSC